MLLYLSIYWTTWWWHTCPGQLGIAREQSPGRALARARWPLTRCTRVSAEKWFVYHHVLPDMTSTYSIGDQTWGDTSEIHTFMKMNLMAIPCFGLNIQVVPLVSSGHEAHTSVMFDELHAFLNVLHVFLACRRTIGNQIRFVISVALLLKSKCFTAYCTHETPSMQCTLFHLQIWSTGSFWQSSSSDSCWTRLYLLLWGRCHPRKWHLQENYGY